MHQYWSSLSLLVASCTLNIVIWVWLGLHQLCTITLVRSDLALSFDILVGITPAMYARQGETRGYATKILNWNGRKSRIRRKLVTATIYMSNGISNDKPGQLDNYSLCKAELYAGIVSHLCSLYQPHP